MTAFQQSSWPWPDHDSRGSRRRSCRKARRGSYRLRQPAPRRIRRETASHRSRRSLLRQRSDRNAAPLSRLAVTFRMPTDTDTLTLTLTLTTMPKSVALQASGDEVTLPGSRLSKRVYQLSEVSALSARDSAVGTIAALGDSITDAGGASPNWQGRWTDVLAAHLQAKPSTAGLGVVNLGIAGGRVACEGAGPSARARLDSDVLALPNLRTLIVFMGHQRHRQDGS